MVARGSPGRKGIGKRETGEEGNKQYQENDPASWDFEFCHTLFIPVKARWRRFGRWFLGEVWNRYPNQQACKTRRPYKFDPGSHIRIELDGHVVSFQGVTPQADVVMSKREVSSASAQSALAADVPCKFDVTRHPKLSRTSKCSVLQQLTC